MSFYHSYNGGYNGVGKVGKIAMFNMENSRTARTALPTLPPTDIIDELGNTLSYYAPSTVPSLIYGSMNEGANATIVRAWARASYQNRTFSPCTCVIFNRGNQQTVWPYGGSNFQSAWWLQAAEPTTALCVELSTTITITRIEFGNTREQFTGATQGQLQVILVTKADGNQITESTVLGAANLVTNKNLVSIPVNRSARMFVFRRINNTGFSRLEKIRIIGA